MLNQRSILYYCFLFCYLGADAHNNDYGGYDRTNFPIWQTRRPSRTQRKHFVQDPHCDKQAPVFLVYAGMVKRNLLEVQIDADDDPITPNITRRKAYTKCLSTPPIPTAYSFRKSKVNNPSRKADPGIMLLAPKVIRIRRQLVSLPGG